MWILGIAIPVTGFYLLDMKYIIHHTLWMNSVVTKNFCWWQYFNRRKQEIKSKWNSKILWVTSKYLTVVIDFSECNTHLMAFEMQFEMQKCSIIALYSLWCSYYDYKYHLHHDIYFDLFYIFQDRFFCLNIHIHYSYNSFLLYFKRAFLLSCACL